MPQYPEQASARDRFVVDRRGARSAHDPWRAQGLVVDEEPNQDGSVARVATVFLTGRECPWRCVMCDLWQHTTIEDTPVGAITRQVTEALAELDRSHGRVDHVKLYNAGSFFDPRAVAEDDYDAVAAALHGLACVTVESHPSLVGARMDMFLDALRRRSAPAPPPRLEVAMGLETAHPQALDALNKKMTLEGFCRAASRLNQRGVGLRVFLLVSPPFVPHAEQDAWLLRSLTAAIGSGAAVVSLIPTRTGNGALDELEVHGQFRAPTLRDLERSLELALAHARPVKTTVLADLWDLERLSTCNICLVSRRSRLHAMNLQQQVLPPVSCKHCSAGMSA